MIIILEQDLRLDGEHKFFWIPEIFKGDYKNCKLTWRICLGFWSISYYPEKGVKDLYDYFKSNQSAWHYKSTR